jgi:hypothetical protein
VYRAAVVAKPRGVYWVGIITAAVCGLLTVGLAVLLVVDVRSSWRYRHAPACSETITSGCRYQVVAKVVDVRSVDHGRYVRDFQLTTADGVRMEVATLPTRWRVIPDGGLPVTLERFDDTVFAVSAADVTRRTTDNPDEQLSLLVPGIPAIAGLVWYSVGCAAAGRTVMTGGAVRAFPRWAQWPRRVALTIVVSAYPAFFASIVGLEPSLTVVLIIWAATAAVTVAVLAWHICRRRAKPASGADRGGRVGDRYVARSPVDGLSTKTTIRTETSWPPHE